MIHRPETFNEVHGHQKLTQFLLERINNKNFPQFTLFSGEEGLGKTTFLKLIAMALSCKSLIKPCYECENCVKIRDKVIRENKDTDNIKTFKMSVEGSTATVKDVLASLNTSFLSDGTPKVIILEECHGMPELAQDALLTDTEYLPKNVYILMATTNTLKLNKTLLSRPVHFSLNRLSNKDMLNLLKSEAARRGLLIQGGDSALHIIIGWSENKPRKALKVLEAMGKDTNVTMDMVKDYIDFLDIKDVIPLLSSLNGSLLVGLHTCMELQLSQSVHQSLIEILVESIKVAYGNKTFKLSNEDYTLIKEAVSEVPKEALIELLYDISSVRELNRGYLIASYLKVHPDSKKVTEGKRELVLPEELKYKQENSTDDVAPPKVVNRENRAPTMNELLMRGKVMKEE